MKTRFHCVAAALATAISTSCTGSGSTPTGSGPAERTAAVGQYADAYFSAVERGRRDLRDVIDGIARESDAGRLSDQLGSAADREALAWRSYSAAYASAPDSDDRAYMTLAEVHRAFRDAADSTAGAITLLSRGQTAKAAWGLSEVRAAAGRLDDAAAAYSSIPR